MLAGMLLWGRFHAVLRPKLALHNIRPLAAFAELITGRRVAQAPRAKVASGRQRSAPAKVSASGKTGTSNTGEAPAVKVQAKKAGGRKKR
jgi:hypothetical protein